MRAQSVRSVSKRPADGHGRPRRRAHHAENSRSSRLRRQLAVKNLIVRGAHNCQSGRARGPRMTWDEACQTILREASGALHYTEIADRIVAQGLREEVGATPAQTVAATISLSLREPNSPYVRVRRGEYTLQSELRESIAIPETAKAEEPETGALKSFGMYWQRSLVLWTRGTQLLGKQSSAASVVNFAEQKGVYLLHDRERGMITISCGPSGPLTRRWLSFQAIWTWPGESWHVAPAHRSR
jgi:hypothetical protein